MASTPDTSAISTLPDPSADAAAAAAAAAHKVLVNFFPANQAALDAELANSLSMIPDGPAKTAGVALGAAIGQEASDARINDGFSSVEPFVPLVGVGFWKPTPPAFAPIVEPQFQNVTPFGIKSRDQFKVKTKKALILTHAKYTAEFNEVKEIGRIDSTTRTADQTHHATSGSRARKLGWSKIANIISINENYDLHETARLLALVNMSMCDGFISGWYWKRVHAFWRPVTAIHEADTDGNPDTIQDASWNFFGRLRLAGLPVDPQRLGAPPPKSSGGSPEPTTIRSASCRPPRCRPALSAATPACRKPAKRMPTRAWWSASTSEPPSNRGQARQDRPVHHQAQPQGVG